MDKVAHGVGSVPAALSPHRRGDRLRGDDAVPLAHEVAQELPRPLFEPIARERALPALHAHATQSEDAEPRPVEPMRPRPRTSVLRAPWAHVEHHRRALAIQRRSGHPKGARRCRGHVETQLGEPPCRLQSHFGDAAARERATGAAAAEQAAAGCGCPLVGVPPSEQPPRPAVGGDHPPAGVDNDDPVGKTLVHLGDQPASARRRKVRRRGGASVGADPLLRGFVDFHVALPIFHGPAPVVVRARKHSRGNASCAKWGNSLITQP